MTAGAGSTSAPSGGSKPTRSSAAKRYGPTIVIGVVVAVIAAVVVAGGGNNTTSSGPSGEKPGEVGLTNLAPVPMTYAEAKEEGKADSMEWADNCDKSTGLLKMASVYAPPCLPKFAGDNGGATAPGVTADEITVVEYRLASNSDFNNILGGKIDTPEDSLATSKAYVEMLSDLFQTYGRKINYVVYEANGAADDATAAQADAVSVAEEYHPFASIGGPTLTPAYAEELARRKILCLSCGMALPDQFYQDHQPFIWGALPSPEQYLQNLSDFVRKQLMGRPAKWAGDPSMKTKARVFGSVSLEQDPPVFTSISDLAAKCGKKSGYEAAATETYLFDIAKFPERATSIVAKLKDAGVTTVMYFGDPIMPIYLTKAATAQDYHPEWIVTGTGLTDTTTLGRTYDQEQWKHAFGVSNLAARANQDQQEAYRLHLWYYGEPPQAEGTSELIYGRLAQLAQGIYMAGPKLTPQTFKAGLFHMPEAGGGPTTIHVSYGDHGHFKTLDPDSCKYEEPRPDYLGGDDATIIYWDGDAQGPDEQGNDGKGMYRYVDMGKRYLPGDLPEGEPKVFDPTNTVMVFEQIPDADKAPDYPSPNKELPADG